MRPVTRSMVCSPSIAGAAALAATCVATFGCSEQPPDVATYGLVTTLEIPAASNSELYPREFNRIGLYTELVSERRYPSDIYFPKTGDLIANKAVLPTVLLLQEGNVDKKHYRAFASSVAAYGFIVVVPNHTAMLGYFGKVEAVNDVLEFVRMANGDADSPLADAVDTDMILVIGHGFGGAVALHAAQGKCEFPFCCCFRSFERPVELRGVVVYGTDLAHIDLSNTDLTTEHVFQGGPVPVIDNHDIPIAMIWGTNDTLSAPDAVEETFEQIQDRPKSMITVHGANHYSITDANPPDGVIPDQNAAMLDQETAIETIAGWSAAMLRALVKNDPDALAYVGSAGTGPHGQSGTVDVDHR